MNYVAAQTLYGYYTNIGPRRTGEKSVKVPAGATGKVVRSGTDDHGVPYSVVLFENNVYVVVPREIHGKRA